MQVSEVSMDSSPITCGFPSIPAMMGFVHNLQRKIQPLHPGIIFSQAGISSHSFIPGVRQVQGSEKITFCKHPPHTAKHVEKNKEGNFRGVSFVQEGKASITISIIIKIEDGLNDGKALAQNIADLLPRLRFAGGNIWGAKKVIFQNCPDTEKAHKQILCRLMPGFVLIDRKSLVTTSMEKGLDALDAILDHLEISRITEEVEQKETVYWQRKSNESGWLVPISVGYHIISEPGYVKNQRDPETLHCFAENVITLGEFLMPHRLDRVENLLWKTHVDEDHGLFVYTQSVD